MVKVLKYDNPDQKIKLKIRQIQVLGKMNLWKSVHGRIKLL